MSRAPIRLAEVDETGRTCVTPECGAPVRRLGARCERCRRKAHSERNSARYWATKLPAGCAEAGCAARVGRRGARCAQCRGRRNLEQVKARYAECRAEGLCWGCGGPSGGPVYCAPCRGVRRIKKAAIQRSGGPCHDQHAS